MSLNARETTLTVYFSIIEPANTGITPAVESFQLEVTCPDENEPTPEPTVEPVVTTQAPEKACDYGYVFNHYSIVCDNVNFATGTSMLQATLDEMDFDVIREVKWLSITQNDGMEGNGLSRII